MKPSEVLLAFVTRVFGPKAARAAKAVLPAAATVVAVVGQWIATGQFDAAEGATALMGFGGAILTYTIPNLTQQAEAALKSGVPVTEAVQASSGPGEQTEFRDDDPESAKDGGDWTAERDEIADVPDPPTDAEIQEAARA